MQRYDYRSLNQPQRAALLHRPGGDVAHVTPIVKEILLGVSQRGDEAVRHYTRQYDGVDLASFRTAKDEFVRATSKVKEGVKRAILDAAASIRAYHVPQTPKALRIQTRPGVQCTLEWRPIQRVGLYVPGGSAPLVSTLLMLAIPANIAGCAEIAVFTPPQRDGSVSYEILFAAEVLGIHAVFKIGGAQAIGAMAFGTETVPMVDKIFGPGNRFVSVAKALVAQPPYNVAIDMIAGPTELLIIADDSSDPDWVACDLLSQAEHGADSQVVLVTPSESLADCVQQKLSEQVSSLPRSAIARTALETSRMVIVADMQEAIEFSNHYAPEHLIVATDSASSLAPKIVNAGSVFLGPLTSVVFGDYASGTNHTLPTAGTASAIGGLTVGSFVKPVFFQTVTEQGLQSLSQTTEILAQAEGLEGHARAARIRRAKRD